MYTKPDSWQRIIVLHFVDLMGKVGLSFNAKKKSISVGRKKMLHREYCLELEMYIRRGKRLC